MRDGRPAYMQQQQLHHRAGSGTSGSSAGAAASGHRQTRARGRGRAAACLEVEVLEDAVYAVFLAPLQVGLQGAQSDWGSGYRRGTGLRHTCTPGCLQYSQGREWGDALRHISGSCRPHQEHGLGTRQLVLAGAQESAEVETVCNGRGPVARAPLLLQPAQHRALEAPVQQARWASGTRDATMMKP